MKFPVGDNLILSDLFVMKARALLSDVPMEAVVPKLFPF